MVKKDSAKKNVDKFWKEKESQLKEEIRFRTYASFKGEVIKGKAPVADKYLGKPPSDKGGLIYGAGNMIYFEDFEKKNPMGILVGGDNAVWTKTERSFSLEDIVGIKNVSEEGARRAIQGKIDPESLSTSDKKSKNLLHNFTRYFCIELKEEKFLFFEILEKKDFLDFIEKRSLSQ